MAVWERKGEDKAILERKLREERNGVLKEKRSGRLFLVVVQWRFLRT
jgi:hypothetical protein